MLKASHFRHLPEVIFDAYDRPVESETMRPANESCELCHWPPAFHGDTVRQITRFEPDEVNTQKDTYLIMKTGAGTREQGLGYGIHWHVSNPVEYIATDHQKQDIRWVRTTLPDGRTVEYNDASNPLTPEEIAEAEKQTMDCVDCHNRVGHPFNPPEDLVDAAIDSDRVSRDLPWAKKLMLDLLSAEYADREEALESVSDLRDNYEVQFPEVAEAMPDKIAEAEAVALDLVPRVVFEEPGITWEDFPDNNKHKDFPGCFRCHDGKHFADDGEVIRLQCNICHSVPATVGEGERPPQLPLAYIDEPASHLETSFIADHRFQADDSCEDCHGVVEFGTDDSSFCANSSCHGKAWPLVDLDANFVHPIELEGKHAETWCHDCHEGVREPEYVCANCHTPPEPHFGDACEDCHTPAGFEGADFGSFEHPMALEGAHADAGCSDCHVEGKEISSDCASCHTAPSDHYGDNCADCHTPTAFADANMPASAHPIELVGAHQTASCDGCHVEGQETPAYICSNCHQPPEDHFAGECETCHAPTSFQDATLPASEHPIELIGAHQTASCDGCHVEGQDMPEFLCSNCHERPEFHFAGECDVCHSPQGWTASAAFLVDIATAITHDLEGRDDCLICHDPAGEIQPAPSNHVDYINEQCLLCHKAAE
jgi:hypothetical protein